MIISVVAVPLAGKAALEQRMMHLPVVKIAA